jgi:prepilin-type processing-associated H-X9-DG protein
LIELLVIVAVVALLVAVVLPSYNAAREVGMDRLCKSNLYHLGQVLWNRGGESNILPNSEAWVSHVRSMSAAGLLVCPKGGYGAEESGTESRSGAIDEVTADRIPAPGGSHNDLQDSYESDTQIRMWMERSSYALPVPVTVDISAPGRYDGDYDLTKKMLPAGTIVHCYMLHYAPVNNASRTASGSITFGSGILGVICKTASLDATDYVLGHPNVQYSTGREGSRGYEAGQEVVELTQDRRTFIIHQYHSTHPGEQARILTESGSTATYGMNVRVKTMSPRTKQILLADYKKTAIDLSVDDLRQWLDGRHFGRANVLLVDGAVQDLDVSRFRSDNPAWNP